MTRRTRLTLPAALAWLLAALPALAASAGAGEAPGQADAGQPLSVGIAAGQGPDAGFGRDLFAAVAREGGYAIAWVKVPRDAELAGLDVGRFDVASGPFTPAEVGVRRRLPSTALAGDALVKRRGDGALMRSADVAGKAVGLLGGSLDRGRLRAPVAALRARVPARTALGDPLADLAAGRLAAVAGPVDGIAAVVAARPEAFEAVGPPFGPVTRLGPAMRAAIDAAPRADAVAAILGRLKADGRLAALQRRWYGLAFDPPDPAVPRASPAPTAKP